jgi:hypothetical protein
LHAYPEEMAQAINEFGSCPKSVIEVEVSFVQRLAGEVAGVNPRFI